MRPFPDFKGAAFDVPEENNAVFEELALETQQAPKGYILEKAVELPDFADDNFNSNGYGNGGGQGSSGNYGRPQ